MDRCGCGDDFASIFDRDTAEKDRDRYRARGPDRTTRMLLELLRAHRVGGATLLDVGGGIGVIGRELLRAGVGHAVMVEASPDYLDVARDEAGRSGLLDRMEFVEGDYVRRAAEVDVADIVTLDRVICCYPDAESLVARSVDHARWLYGLVLPRDGWHIRLALGLNNLRFWLQRSPYRSYGHSNGRIDELAGERGFRRLAERRTFFWRVVLYAREPSAT
jgi:magnesium-protoporphyrin O-methyltransferase